MIAFPELEREHRVTVKIRYRAPVCCAARPPAVKRQVIFDQPRRRLTPGQARYFTRMTSCSGVERSKQPFRCLFCRHGIYF